MRLVIQRVRQASVTVDDEVVGEIGRGAVVLVGVARDDTKEDALHLAGKTARLRIFPDAENRLNEPVTSVDGSFLVISQFTLYGDCRKGNRPSYGEAASPEEGRLGYETYLNALREEGIPVETGVYQAQMTVRLENDGPVTILVESRGRTRV